MKKNHQHLEKKILQILKSEFKSLRDYNLSLCKLTEVSDDDLRELLLCFKNTDFHNKAGYLFELLYGAKNKGIMPQGFFDPLNSKSLEPLHQFKSKLNNYDSHAKRWHLSFGFPLSLIK